MACANGALLLARCGDQQGCYELAAAGLSFAPSDVYLLDFHLGAAVQISATDTVSDGLLSRAASIADASPTLLLNITAVACTSRRYALGLHALGVWDARHDTRPDGVHLNAAVLYWGAERVDDAHDAVAVARQVGDDGAAIVEAALHYHQGRLDHARQAFRDAHGTYAHFACWADDHLMESPRTDPAIDALFQTKPTA